MPKQLSLVSRRSFVAKSVGAAFACSTGLALDDAFAANSRTFIELQDLESNWTLVLSEMQFRNKLEKIFGFAAANLIARLNGMFRRRYPTFNIELCIQQAFAANIVLTVSKYVNGQAKYTTLPFLISTLTAQMAPTLAGSFGLELIQLELRNRGFTENRAKFVGVAFVGVLFGVFQYYVVPTIADAIANAFSHSLKTKPELRRKLKKTGILNVSPMAQITLGNHLHYYAPFSSSATQSLPIWKLGIDMPPPPADPNWAQIIVANTFISAMQEPPFLPGHDFSTDASAIANVYTSQRPATGYWYDTETLYNVVFDKVHGIDYKP